MAKARPIEGLRADDPYAAAAAKVVAVRAREVADHSRDVLDITDIERVHDMRVATRRLRAALEIFEPCFPEARHQEALGEVKAVADALGERRDADVTVAALEDFAAGLAAPDRPGVASLLAQIRAEQAEANGELEAFVRPRRLAALSERLSELVMEAEGLAAEESQVKPRRVKKLDPREPLAENAARIVTVRLEEMRSFAPKALKAGGVKQQHNMRIAAKRLRYILEATEFCFGRSALIARRRARDLQEILGELHDCDVMLPRVERHLAELRDADADSVRERAGDADDLDPGLAARAPHRTSYRGLEILMVYLQARRRLLFERFSSFWVEQERAGTWDRLERTAERRLSEARERRRAAKRAEKARLELEAAEQLEREAASRAAAAAAELREAWRTAPDDRSAPPGPSSQPPARIETRDGERSHGP